MKDLPPDFTEGHYAPRRHRSKALKLLTYVSKEKRSRIIKIRGRHSCSSMKIFIHRLVAQLLRTPTLKAGRMLEAMFPITNINTLHCQKEAHHHRLDGCASSIKYFLGFMNDYLGPF